MNKLHFARVAPFEAQKEQVDGQGWAWRYKVRIFGKHTQDKTILPDEDLPWAQVLLPVTAGSGAANYATSPMINQGDTVSIAFYDDDEQQPIITGVLPRTELVSRSEPDDTNGLLPHSGYTENRESTSKTTKDESHQSNEDSQPSTRSDRFSGVPGDTTVLGDNCDPNAYKTNAIVSELNNLFNQIQQFSGDAAYIETLTVGTIDRVHSLVNPYVGEIFNKLFENLVPVLNAGLRALYKAVYAKVLAATENPVAARLAAEAALIALKPAILALQEAIQLLAAQVVDDMVSDVEDLVRQTVKDNDNFTNCAGTQFSAAIVNDIISRTDDGMGPLLNAVNTILSGGFNVVNAARSGVDLFTDLTGGLLSIGQGGGGKCGGTPKEYAFGIGPVKDAGNLLGDVIQSANTAASLVENAAGLQADISDLNTEEQEEFLKTFGDFPFLSGTTGQSSDLDECSTAPPEICFGPEVILFGGRGEGAKAEAVVGNYVPSTDDRTTRDAQGGVIAVEVLDGGSGYQYPPFVNITDNCGLGIGAVARAVLKGDKVDKIYMVTPGEGYPAESEDNFYVDDVVIVNGGNGYTPGIVEDNFDGDYEVVTDENGTVTDIIPKTPVPIPELPVINIPEVSPPIPPGGNIITDDNGISVVVDKNGVFIGTATIGNGLVFYPVIRRLPSIADLNSGNVTPDLAERLSQDAIVQIIDCIQS